jgi:hypothetical protein
VAAWPGGLIGKIGDVQIHPRALGVSILIFSLQELAAIKFIQNYWRNRNIGANPFTQLKRKRCQRGSRRSNNIPGMNVQEKAGAGQQEHHYRETRVPGDQAPSP